MQKVAGGNGLRLESRIDQQLAVGALGPGKEDHGDD
jgi:hypothetical protein